MIIESDFHDYYDHIQKMGMDRSVVYRRYSQYYTEFHPELHEFTIVGVCRQRWLVYREVLSGNKLRNHYGYDAIRAHLASQGPKYLYSKESIKHLNAINEFYQDFHDFGFAPIWVADSRGIAYNCALPSGFQKIMDSYTIYQEINMWLSNQVEPRKEIPAIDNKTMIEIKGFDPKYSFRKSKSKK